MSLERNGRPKRQQSRKLLLVVDGESEKTYFEYFVGRNRNLKIEIKPSKDQSSYRRTLEYCTKLKRIHEIDLDKGDCVAIVTDVDDHSQSEVTDFVEECRKKKMELYLSNPCFEVWLVLHYRPLSKWMQREDLNELLTELLGRKYIKSVGIPLDGKKIDTALMNAHNQSICCEDINLNCIRSSVCTTAVHSLVDKIFSFNQPLQTRGTG